MEKTLSKEQFNELMRETITWCVLNYDKELVKQGEIRAYEDTLRYISKDYPLHFHIRKKIDKLKGGK